MRPDLGGGVGVVAGDHLDGDAGPVAVPHGVDRFLPRGVDDSYQGKQGESVLGVVGVEDAVRGGAVPVGEGQNPQSLRGGLGGAALPVGAVDADRFAGVEVVRARREYPLGGRP